MLSPRRPLLLAGALLLAVFAGCADDNPVHDPLDLEPVDTDGKADGPFSRFDRNRLISDDAFADIDAVTASEVQRFLEMTPYGKRSFLADKRIGGERVSAALVRVARSRGVNPIVLLVTLQKEAGLISRSQAPSNHRVDFAFGCGCRDGNGCASEFKGLDKQLECAADRLAEYTADLHEKGSTISGWEVGDAKQTLDPVSVKPHNRATAALYTYTPWVLPNRGGNWLFWNVWRRFAGPLGYDEGLVFPFNEGYIGGNCSSDSDCNYDGGRCLFAVSGIGTCSKDCTRTCPDERGTDGYATSFCVGDGSLGFCLAQCDDALTPTGCGERQQCTRRARFNDPNTTRMVCMPALD